jgi:CheY-like chemotaxis protein
MPIPESQPKITVLIVEDSDVTRYLLDQYFARLGHDVLHAADPETAWQRLNASRVDLVILDVNLTHAGSGLEFLERMRLDVRFADTAVVVWTAMAKLDQSQQAVVDRCGAQLLYKGASIGAVIDSLLERLTNGIRTDRSST